MKRLPYTHLHLVVTKSIRQALTHWMIAQTYHEAKRERIIFFSFPIISSIECDTHALETWTFVGKNEPQNSREVLAPYIDYAKAVQNCWCFLHHYFDWERIKNLVCSIAHLLVKLLATVLKTMACRKRPRTHAEPTHTHTNTLARSHTTMQTKKRNKTCVSVCLSKHHF